MTDQQDPHWHILKHNPRDLPEPGERVIICVGYAFVGEGYLKYENEELKWYRYCDFEPLEKYMSQKVTAWMPMPKPIQKESKKRKEGQTT